MTDDTTSHTIAIGSLWELKPGYKVPARVAQIAVRAVLTAHEGTKKETYVIYEWISSLNRSFVGCIDSDLLVHFLEDWEPVE